MESDYDNDSDLITQAAHAGWLLGAGTIGDAGTSGGFPEKHFNIGQPFARAASNAVLTFFCSSAGGRTAGIPRACIHNSRVQPAV